jgi:hypothetical protein
METIKNLDNMDHTARKTQLIQAIATVATQQKLDVDVPLTDIDLAKDIVQQLETQTIALEQVNPNPQPLKTQAELLNGTWQLIYSTAREIRTLTTLPLGFQLGRVYQVIDVATKSFFNQAFCKHRSNALEGNVLVTATFSAAPTPADGIPDRKINVDFKQRSIFIEKILGFPFPSSKPIKVVEARNPVGRIPSLTITYLDEDFRIGRGGDGSLFVLKKVEKVA